MNPTSATYFRYIKNRSFDEIPNCNVPVPVRTLYITSHEPICHLTINEFFNQFDDLEFVNWHQINQAQYGFVQFKTTNGAEAALQHSDYRFGNTILNVIAGKPWHQPDFPSDLKRNLLNSSVLDTNFIHSTQNHGNNCDVPIRTLYVTSNKPIPVQQFCNHFEQFDGVECFRWHSINGFDYGFVQFIDIDDAEEVLSQPLQMCDSAIIKVSIAHKHFQPSAISIDMLNNDVLRYIFRYINVDDRSVVVDVCVRFRQQAQAIFSLIQSMTVHDESNVNWIIKYCNPKYLKTIEFKKMLFTENSMEQLRPYFMKLRKIHMSGCKSECFNTNVLPTTMELEELYVNNTFKVFDLNLLKIINHFVTLNPDLRKLALGRYCILSIENLSSLQGQCFKNLVELELNVEYGFELYCSMRELKLLKVLKLSLRGMCITQLLVKPSIYSSSIEQLELFNVTLNSNNIHSINFKLNQIKTLKLINTSYSKPENLLNLFSKFPKLHTFCIEYTPFQPLTGDVLGKLLVQAKMVSILTFIFSSSNLSISNEEYDEMLRIIQQRIENRSVLINIQCEEWCGSLPTNKIIQNRNYLDIRVVQDFQ